MLRSLPFSFPALVLRKAATTGQPYAPFHFLLLVTYFVYVLTPPPFIHYLAVTRRSAHVLRYLLARRGKASISFESRVLSLHLYFSLLSASRRSSGGTAKDPQPSLLPYLDTSRFSLPIRSPSFRHPRWWQEDWATHSFVKLSVALLSLYISPDEISHEELRALVSRSYTTTFRPISLRNRITESRLSNSFPSLGSASKSLSLLSLQGRIICSKNAPDFTLQKSEVACPRAVSAQAGTRPCTLGSEWSSRCQ